MRGCPKCKKPRALPVSFSQEGNEMTIEILTKAGLTAVRESDLAMYKSKGATMPDGSAIATQADKAEAKKASDEVKATKKKKSKPKADKPEG